MKNQYNHNEVSKLIMLAKGDNRTMKKFASDAKISASTLSSILTGKRKATIRNIQMITSDDAKPQNGVTVEQLATACGFVNIPVSPFASNIILTETSKDAPIEDRFNHQRELEIIAAGIIQNLLLGKEIPYISKKHSVRFYSPSLAIELMDKRIWWFEFDSFINVSNTSMKMKIQQILLQIFFVKVDENRTITILVDTEEAFDFFTSLGDEIAYKGNLSVAYLNREKMCIEKEKYLSLFSEATGRELYLLEG